MRHACAGADRKSSATRVTCAAESRAHAARAGSCSPHNPERPHLPLGFQLGTKLRCKPLVGAAPTQPPGKQGQVVVAGQHHALIHPQTATQSRAPRRTAGAWHAGSDRPKPPPHPHAAGAQSRCTAAHTSGSCAPKCRSERCINLWVVAIANAGAGCKTPASFLPSPSALSASTFNDGERALLHDLRGEAWHQRSPRLQAVPGAWCSGRRQRRFSQRAALRQVVRWQGRAAANVPAALVPPATGAACVAKTQRRFHALRSPSKPPSRWPCATQRAPHSARHRPGFARPGRPPAGR